MKVESRHSLFKSFQFAFEGVRVAIEKGRNFRIQIGLGILACIFGLILGLTITEWLDLTLIIAIVLILELLNTAVESIVDMVSPEIQPKAKIAKDVAAAAVLIASAASLAIGAFIFLPKIFG
jgi:diacylglycerol kinase